MIKQSVALAALLSIAGCASLGTPPSSSAKSQAAQAPAPQPPTPPELAAYAGSHQYPLSEPAHSDIRAAALVNGDTIKIYNFGTDAIRDADIWVNRAFVQHVGAIAPGSSIAIHTSDLYNAVGQQFSAKGEHVNMVQVEQDHNLQNLMGPAAE
jgi:hypothetical protein